jgi:hypothetical protein
MKTAKISLAAIKGKLSRAEMKNIMAGSGGSCDSQCTCGPCTFSSGGSGSCRSSDSGGCFCASGSC